MDNAFEEIISTHHLIPHPEGGYYKETYRSGFSTGIFYLLGSGQKSSLHRIKSDEMWHFYEGDSLIIVEIIDNGEVKETTLNRQNPQYTVLANHWFGAYLPSGSAFAFTGCTVAPAFNFKDFEMGDKNLLLKNYPKAKLIIEKLLG